MRWHWPLPSRRNAASSIAQGALDKHRATGLRNTPDLTEKNAIAIPLFSSPPHCQPIFSCSWSCVYTASLSLGASLVVVVREKTPCRRAAASEATHAAAAPRPGPGAARDERRREQSRFSRRDSLVGR